LSECSRLYVNHLSSVFVSRRKICILIFISLDKTDILTQRPQSTPLQPNQKFVDAVTTRRSVSRRKYHTTLWCKTKSRVPSLARSVSRRKYHTTLWIKTKSRVHSLASNIVFMALTLKRRRTHFCSKITFNLNRVNDYK
jgi:hypothetical protein